MNTRLKTASRLVVGLAAMSMVIGAQAGFVGTDDFDDNAKDPTKWGSDSAFNFGVFDEANGRLEFTAGSASVFNFASRPWILNSGSYSQSWSVQLDVHVDDGTMGLFLNKSGALQTQAVLFLADEPSFGTHAFRGGITQDIGVPPPTGRVSGVQATNAVDAALRIAFDASSKDLLLQIDEDGALNGYAWTTLVQGDIDDPALTWGMNDSSTFELTIQGSSRGVAVSGQVYGDNFLATRVPGPGTLGLLVLGLAGLGWRRTRRTA